MKNQVHPSLWHGHSLGPSGAQTPSLILSFPSRAGEVCVSPRRRRAIPPPLLISLLTTASHVTVIFPILHGRSRSTGRLSNLIKVTKQGSSRGRICTWSQVSPKPTVVTRTPRCCLFGCCLELCQSTFVDASSSAPHPGSVYVIWPRVGS